MPNQTTQTILSQVESIIDKTKDSSVLLSIRALLDAKLEDVKQIEIEKLRSQAIELQRNYGIDPDELTSSLFNNRGKGLSVKAKYRSKTNPSDSWTGRGKQPNWIHAYLAENPNHKLDDLLTEKSAPAKAEEQKSAPAKDEEQKSAPASGVKK